MASSPTIYDVAIIGCGPVGALAANLLGRSGLQVLVVERESVPHPLPRAVHLDHEMMRLFQDAAVIERIKNDLREAEGHLHLGADGATIRFLGTAGRPKPFGWSNDYFFYQPELEAHLREALAAYPNVHLNFGWEVQQLTQHDDRVELMLRSSDSHETECARWVIACDGARSSVRKQLNVALDDLNFEEPWLVVDAEVEGPVHFPSVPDIPPNTNLQKLSVMVCDPNRPTTVVPGRGNHRRWEFMLLPGESDDEMMQPAKVAQLIAPWVSNLRFRIVRAATYRFHGLVAQQWQVQRVFLAGDAAHQTPPFFGQGMCHGFRDVANLAWKLNLVVRGHADSKLLRTYQLERDPHVRAIIAAAIDAGRYICILDAKQAMERDRAMRHRARAPISETAADLIPAIAEGVIAGNTEGAGVRFIQPCVKVGRVTKLLDDMTCGGWRIFVRNADMARHAQAAADALLPKMNIKVFDIASLNDDDAISHWLDAHLANAVLVRPDFYVFGSAPQDPAALIDALAKSLPRPAAGTMGGVEFASFHLEGASL